MKLWTKNSNLLKKIKEELRKSKFKYEKLFNNASDAVFIVKLDSNSKAKYFTEANSKACKMLGYTKKEIINLSPDKIIEYKEDIFSTYDYKSDSKKQNVYDCKFSAKDGTKIFVELSISCFDYNESSFFQIIARDITERKKVEEQNLQYSRILEGVLKGISDVIGVYSPDNTVMFYNEAGYNFFKKTPDEVKGKKCFEMFFRKKNCPNCGCKEVMKLKKKIKIEKYIPQIGRYIESIYNPVMDNKGDILFIVEQLRDITERKKLMSDLIESEKMSRKILEVLPDITIITLYSEHNPQEDGKIVYANKEAMKLYNINIGTNIMEYIPMYFYIGKKRRKEIVNNKQTNTIFNYKLRINNRLLDMEIASGYLTYMGKPAIISILRDVTERKRELNEAAKIQRQVLPKIFPIPEKVEMERVYIPAKIVSGDFYILKKLNENLVIGLIGDVSGKGITAALSISAFNVLFDEAILESQEPRDIINNLNKKIMYHLDEKYIAACCFSFDFNKHEMKVVGAGINQFFIQSNQKCFSRIIVKGPFLGMFEESIFDEKIFKFKQGDKFLFFTDGLDFLFEEDCMKDKLDCMKSIKSFADDLKIRLLDMMRDVLGVKDDCTLLAFEIKGNESNEIIKSNNYVLYGIENYKTIIENVVKEVKEPNCSFDIRLILTEALTNAFEHGNNKEKDKPIYLKYTLNNKCIKLEIEDSGERVSNIVIPENIDEKDLLEESGRGLFLIKAIADKVQYKNNRLIIEKKLC